MLLFKLYGLFITHVHTGTAHFSLNDVYMDVYHDIPKTNPRLNENPVLKLSLPLARYPYMSGIYN